MKYRKKPKIILYPMINVGRGVSYLSVGLGTGLVLKYGVCDLK